MPGSSVRQRQGLTPVQPVVLVVLVVLVAVIGVVEFVGVAAQHDAVGVEVGVEVAPPGLEDLLRDAIAADGGSSESARGLLDMIDAHGIAENLDPADLEEFRRVFSTTLNELVAAEKPGDANVGERVSADNGDDPPHAENNPTLSPSSSAAGAAESSSLSGMLGGLLGDLSSSLTHSSSTLSAMISSAVSSLTTSVTTFSSPNRPTVRQAMETFSGCLWPTFAPTDGRRRELPSVMEDAVSMSADDAAPAANATPEDPRSERLLAWLRSGGSTVNSLGIRKHAWGREVFATENIQSRTIVSSVPRSHLMRISAAAKGSAVARKILRVPTQQLSRDQREKIVIAVHILETIGTKDGNDSSGSSSSAVNQDGASADFFFRPYVEMMPLTLPHMPLFWSLTDMISLEGSATWLHVMRQRRAIRSEWLLLEQVVPEFTGRFSFNDFAWSRAIIMTRAFRVRFDFGSPISPSKLQRQKVRQNPRQNPTNHEKQQIQDQALASLYFRATNRHLSGGEPAPFDEVLGKLPRSSVQRKVCHNDVLVMAPLADMLNHRVKPNTAWRYSSSLDSFTLVATDDIAAGQAVYDSYGVKPNDALLRTFGFVDHDFDQVLMQYRVATAQIGITHADFLPFCPNPSKRRRRQRRQRRQRRAPHQGSQCPKVGPRDALLMSIAWGRHRFVKGATTDEQKNARETVPETLHYFKVSQSLNKASLSLFKYFSALAIPFSYSDMSPDSADRDSRIALMTRLEREFSEDEERACRVGACDLWRIDETKGEKDRGARATPLMEIFRDEWFRVISHRHLTGNQRNGFLLRVEERAAYRFLLRIVRSSLVSSDQHLVGDSESSGATPSHDEEALLQRLQRLGNITWMEDVSTGALEGEGDQDVVAEAVETGEEVEGEESVGSHDVEVPDGNEEARKKSLADEAAVEAAVEAELTEQAVLAEVVAEVTSHEAGGDHPRSLVRGHSDPITYSPSEAIVVEISGVSEQTIRLSLPAPRTSAGAEDLRPDVQTVSYETIEEALGLMVSGLTTAEEHGRPQRGDYVLAKASETELFYSGVILSSMDDGSHIVQFDTYLGEASAAIHGWIGPTDVDRRVYYNIPPKDIVKITPTSKYSNRRRKGQKHGPDKRFVTPTAWRAVVSSRVEEEGSILAQVPPVGSEVFAHWKENKAHMYFDGVVVKVSADAQVASVRYNDGDEEEGLAARTMFVRVY